MNNFFKGFYDTVKCRYSGEKKTLSKKQKIRIYNPREQRVFEEHYFCEEHYLSGDMDEYNMKKNTFIKLNFKRNLSYITNNQALFASCCSYQSSYQH